MQSAHKGPSHRFLIKFYKSILEFHHLCDVVVHCSNENLAWLTFWWAFSQTAKDTSDDNFFCWNSFFCVFLKKKTKHEYIAHTPKNEQTWSSKDKNKLMFQKIYNKKIFQTIKMWKTRTFLQQWAKKCTALCIKHGKGTPNCVLCAFAISLYLAIKSEKGLFTKKKMWYRNFSFSESMHRRLLKYFHNFFFSSISLRRFTLLSMEMSRFSFLFCIIICAL